MGKIRGRRKGTIVDKIPNGKVFISILPPELYERLHLEAEASRLTMAKVYRIALKKFFESIDSMRNGGH